MIYYQLKMIYLPGKNDLFAKQKWFILNHKTLGTIQLFWQAVLRINHLNGSHHSVWDKVLPNKVHNYLTPRESFWKTKGESFHVIL